MKGQSKKHSAIETGLNIAIGAGVSLSLQEVLFPWYGIQIPQSSHVGILVAFTVASIVRGYYVRRLFNWWHVRQHMTITLRDGTRMDLSAYHGGK